MNERKRVKTMSKRARQYIGILAAVIAYYLVHEGAHLLYALFTGVFRQIKFMGLGVQVDVFREHMTDTQLGIFCLVGALATFCIAYLLTAIAKKIGTAESKLFRAVLYYITIALLLIDPLYLGMIEDFGRLLTHKPVPVFVLLGFHFLIKASVVICFVHSEHLLQNRNSRLIPFENQAAMYVVYSVVKTRCRMQSGGINPYRYYP